MGSGSRVTIGYKYYMGVHSGIARGPVNELVAWEADGKTVWEGSITTNQQISIEQPNLFGGEKKEGGLQGTLDVMMGGADQVAPTGLIEMLGDDVPGFRGAFSLFYDGLVSAMSPYIKPWKFRVRRSTAGWDGGAWYPEKAMIPLADGAIHAMNPAHILFEVMTNREWSRGVNRARFADDSWRAAADQLYAEGFGLCLRWNRRESVRSFIQHVVDHIGGEVYQSRFDGLFYIRLIRDDYVAAELPLFDEDSGLLSIEEDDISAVDGAVNEIVIRYRDPITDKVRMWRERNLAAIHAQGQVVSETIDYPGLPTPELAGRIAVRELRSRGGYMRRFKVRLDRRGYRLEPGAAFRIRDLQRGIDNMVVRVGRIEDGTLTDGAITIVCPQDVFGLPANSMSAIQPSGWVRPDSTPQAIAFRKLMEATYRDLAEQIDPANLALVDDADCRLMALAVKPTPLSMGYLVESRVAPGDWVGQGDDGGFCPSGTIATQMGPTDTSVLVLGGVDLDFVAAGTIAMLGDELVRVDAWDVVTNTGTLARGCVDTVPVTHAAGARIWFMADNTALTDTVYVAGTAVQTRLLTQTSTGKLPTGSAPVDSITTAGRQGRPYPPGQLRINSIAYPLIVMGALQVAWAHRDRLLQADQVIESAQGSIGPEPGTTYTIQIFAANGTTLLATSTGLTGTSWDWPAEATENTTSINRIKLWSVRDGQACHQTHDWYIERAGLGFNLGNHLGGI